MAPEFANKNLLMTQEANKEMCKKTEQLFQSVIADFKNKGVATDMGRQANVIFTSKSLRILHVNASIGGFLG